MKVRCLTESGIGEFRAYLVQLREDGRLPPPKSLLNDPNHSCPLDSGVIEVEPRKFANRRVFADYIDRQFSSAGKTGNFDKAGLWEWLSLFYFDAVCPVNQDGKRKPYDDARHLVRTKAGSKKFRHLLRGPYLMYRQYSGGTRGELDLLLEQQLNFYDAASTALGERPRLFVSPGTLIAASRMYFDKATKRPKPRYADSDGGLREFCKFLNNLPTSLDLAALSADAVIALLPEQFHKWTSQLKFANQGQLADELSPVLQDLSGRALTNKQATIRSRAFRKSVIDAYQSKCAISGLGLTHAGSVGAPQHEVEAAHIIPVEHNGKDIVQNGLALARTLHWAFDRGMLWISDELRVSLSAEAERDNRNEWLRQFNSRPLALPAQRCHYPHAEALRWHAKHIAGV